MSREDLQRARRSYAEQRWAEAFAALERADGHTPLAREDLERLAWSAALLGNDEAFLATLERLHQACVDAHEPRMAARAAFWIGFRLLSQPATGRATGWLARAQRHLDSGGGDCAERGYLLLPEIVRHLGGGDNQAAASVAGEASAIGEREHDADLVALARNLEGRALLRLKRTAAGLALLDEVMLAATGNELSPVVTGIVYCNVIATCRQVHAVDRAREWTQALAGWCDAQPQLINFTGLCLIHRSEILELGGDWPAALHEVQKICDRVCADPDPSVFAGACYQLGELLRLRGALDDAEAAYRRAAEHGHDPQPGLALLRLLQGRPADAVTAVERALATTTASWQRARLLPATIDILLAAGDVARARAAGRELDALAADLGTAFLDALAAHARGAIRLADGDAGGAVEPLRHAFAVWQTLGAPYRCARIRVDLGRACRALGDADAAALELETARRVFSELGAAGDLAGLAEQTVAPRAHGLTPRELEVLRLVAGGKTNKAIARALGLSERTVDRHVSNIFAKIDVPSRAAATAFAYQNHLI